MENLLKRIQGQQLTVDKLLLHGFLGSKANPSTQEDAVGVVEILYQENDCTIGFVDYGDKINGKAYEMPAHVHLGSVQVIQVVRKSVLMKINSVGNPLKVMDRIMYEGEVCVIRPFEEHKTIPLEAGAKIVFINVPCEPGFDPYQQGEPIAQ